MIQFTAVASSKQRPTTDLLVLPFYKEEKKVEADISLDPSVKQALALGDFSGDEGEAVIVYTQSGAEKRILLLGLGEKKRCTSEAMRKAGGCVAKIIKKKKISSVFIASFNLELAEGLLLGSYTFDQLKGEKAKKESGKHLKKVCILSEDKRFSQQASKLMTLVEAVNFTRDLVNGNADDTNVDFLIETSRKLAKEHASLKVTVLGKKQLEKENMGLILAVNRSAIRDPALILIEYKGAPKKKELTAVVGKGITYDTGGLHLKPGNSMDTMKADMAGASTVLGVMKAAAELKLPCNIIGVLTIAENCIGPDSYKPGDVYKGRDGITVEITSTDAEGRLVLADAMSYVQDHFPVTQMIDFATLTGGIVVALGEEISGLYSNNDDLAKTLIASGESSGDPVWRMPLRSEYHEMMKSKVADMKNSAGRKASPCTAAAFLQAFVRETKGNPLPWAHIDIAGPAFLDDPKGYHPTQATGVGVRLMIDFFENRHLA